MQRSLIAGLPSQLSRLNGSIAPALGMGFVRKVIFEYSVSEIFEFYVVTELCCLSLSIGHWCMKLMSNVSVRLRSVRPSVSHFQAETG